MSDPRVLIKALERERESHKRDDKHAAALDKELAYYRAQPVPTEKTLDTGAVVADRTEAYLTALRAEKARYPDRAKEIDKEIAATERGAGKSTRANKAGTVERAVDGQNPGLSTATLDIEPKE